jgi:hypothetical protein
MKIIRISLTDSEPSNETLRLFDEARDHLSHELYSEFQGEAEMPASDSDTHFHIHVLATRHLGEVTTLIRQKLKRYQVTERAVIERL